MKKKLKLLVLDALIVLLNILVFNSFISTGFTFGKVLLSILCVGGSAVLHFGGHIFADIREEKMIMERNRKMFKSEDDQFDEYMGQLRKLQLTESGFAGVINRFTQQVDAFNDKEESLIRIIDLNNGAAKEFLISRNDEVQRFLLKNLKKFVKRLIVYSAKTKKNRSATIEEDASVMAILKNNDDLIDLYDKLLDEVAMMGDDFNIDDPGLQSVIESLKELRIGEEDDDDDDGEINLHVVSDIHGK